MSKDDSQMSPMKRHVKPTLLCSIGLIGLILVPHIPLVNLVPTQTLEQRPTGQFEPSAHGVSNTGIVPASYPALPPIIQGWGGVTLDEVANGQLQPTLQRLSQSGYNGVRIGFSGSVTQCSSGELGSWSPDWFNQTIQAAQQYKLWVILDYHSYLDLVNSVCQTEWLSFWKVVLSTNWGYDRIVWEPINEPAGSVTVLSSAYQAWITLARGLGDKHWIAVENTISNEGCSFDPLSLVSCYPVVTDPLNETFLSIHPYFFYDLWSGTTNTYGNCSPSSANTWGNSTAECVANIYNQGMLQASNEYHMPILDTEGGAVYYSCNNVCANPPDAVGTDDASYSRTTFHFIQYLTDLMQSEHMGWVWWEAGEGSCCGAMDTWGSLLRFQPVNPPAPPNTPPTLEAPSGESVIAGSGLSFKVKASDPDIPPQYLTLSCFNCPEGASFPTAIGLGLVTGNFNWTPIISDVGQHNIRFTVSDGKENSSATILITVFSADGPPRNVPPVLIIPGNETVTVASTIFFSVSAIDINIPLQTLVLTCLDCASLGAAFSAATSTSPIAGIFIWGPSSNRVPGNYLLHFEVTDGINVTLAGVQITVAKAQVEIVASVYPRTTTIGLAPLSASDTATLAGGFNPTGAITFVAYFSNASCIGIPPFTSTVFVDKNGNYASQSFTPHAPGVYQWQTSYTGDLNNFPAETQCGHSSEIMTVSPATPTPQPQPSPPCQCNPSAGSSSLGVPIFWLAIGGIAGLVAVAVAVISRKRIRRKLSG